MRRSRKILVATGAFAAAVLLALLLLPLLFRDRIEAQLRASIDASVNARVAWDDAGMSLLRAFPDVAVSVDGLSIAGHAPFAGDTLLRMDGARLVLDAGSVVRHLRRGDRLVVRELVLRQPVARLRVLEDGRANWDIVRERERHAGGEGRDVRIALRELRVTGGAVTLDDRQARLTASVLGLDETLRGDFSRDRFELVTRTRADTVSVRFAGIPYLHRVRVDLDARIDADMRTRRFALDAATLRLNELVVAVAGSVTAGTPDLGLDLNFSSPRTAFGDILSLVPAIYAQDFHRLRTAGTMAVAGRIRGRYGPAAFPALALRARVRDGAFQHPDLAMPARAIALDLAIDNPGGHADRTVLHVERARAVIGGRPVAARLVMRTPVSDPDLDFRLDGTLDLADLRRTVKLEGVSELRGLVAANVAMRARMSDVDARRHDRIAGRGSVHASRIMVHASDLPQPIAIDTLAVRLTPQAAVLSAFAARSGRSDVQATGALDNLLGFALRGEDLRGRATMRSRRVDLDEWRSEGERNEVIPVPPHVDLALVASVAEVRYGALTAANVRGGVRIRERRATVDELAMETLRGSIVANGFYETTVAGRPTFDVSLQLASIDIPAAFAALGTVRTLAPIARWARGTVSGSTRMRGPMLPQMTPDFATMSGSGMMETERLVMQGAPALDKVADALKIGQLRNPSIGAVRVAYEVAAGRVTVRPFAMRAAGIDMTVAGSSGIDQSLAYDLRLAVPRALLGPAASHVVAQAGRAGVALPASDVVHLGARIGGTVSQPTVQPDFGGVVSGARQAAAGAVRQEVATRTAAVREKADSAEAEARRRASAEAGRIIAGAEHQAAELREEARAMAASVRREAAARADSLEARATGPASRIAAKAAADRLRREADQQAERITGAADVRAEGIITDAKRRAGALDPPPR